MKSVELDFLSIIVATIIYMLIGFLWYSPFIFGKMWAKHSKIDMKSAKKQLMPIIYSFINAFVICFFLALLISFLGVNTSFDGAFVGFGIWLGFVATTKISSVIWAKQSFKVYLIDVSCLLASFCVIGALLGS